MLVDFWALVGPLTWGSGLIPVLRCTGHSCFRANSSDAGCVSSTFSLSHSFGLFRSLPFRGVLGQRVSFRSQHLLRFWGECIDAAARVGKTCRVVRGEAAGHGRGVSLPGPQLCCTGASSDTHTLPTLLRLLSCPAPSGVDLLREPVSDCFCAFFCVCTVNSRLQTIRLLFCNGSFLYFHFSNEILEFPAFCSSFLLKSMGLFVIITLNPLSDNSNIWIFRGSASVDFFSPIMGHLFLFPHMLCHGGGCWLLSFKEWYYFAGEILLPSMRPLHLGVGVCGTGPSNATGQGLCVSGVPRLSLCAS